MKKYKILDIHPRDNFYDMKDEFIGKILILVDENFEYISGWSSTTPYFDLVDDYGNYVGFLAVKLEEVE